MSNPDERDSKPVHWDLIREAFGAGYHYANDAVGVEGEFHDGAWDQAEQAAFGLWESDPENMTPAMQVALGLRAPFAKPSPPAPPPASDKQCPCGEQVFKYCTRADCWQIDPEKYVHQGRP